MVLLAAPQGKPERSHSLSSRMVVVAPFLKDKIASLRHTREEFRRVCEVLGISYPMLHLALEGEEEYTAFSHYALNTRKALLNEFSGEVSKDRLC